MSFVKGAPGYSLEDARQLYLKERIGDGHDPRRHAARNRLAKLFVRAGAGGLPASTLLVDLTRQHARDVRDHLLTYDKPGGGKVAPASVKRDLTIMKAMIGHAIREFDLIKTASNPFEVLEVGSPSSEEDDIAAREQRETLPDTVIAAMKGKLQGELKLIWEVLAGTGCRLAEVSGLRRDDVCDIDGPIPHIIIRPNSIRRLKNSSSRRSVPLFGEALQATLQALSLYHSSRLPLPPLCPP